MYDEAGVYNDDTSNIYRRGLDGGENIHTGLGTMDRSNNNDQIFGETPLRSTQALQNEQTAEVGAQKDRTAVLPERSRINNGGQAGKGLFFNAKKQQFEIINNSNPPNDDFHTWIRSVDVILTFEEAISEGDGDFTPDYTEKMAEEVLKSGHIKVYSSYPIENGVLETAMENLKKP